MIKRRIKYIEIPTLLRSTANVTKKFRRLGAIPSSAKKKKLNLKLVTEIFKD